jgi:hypothetical protein
MPRHFGETAVTTALLLTALLWPAVSSGAVYQWTDENGVTHYAVDRDEVPVRLRTRLTPDSRLIVEPPPPEAVQTPEQPIDQASTPAEDPAALELGERIQRDREALKEIISRGAQGEPGLGQDPRLREIAERLPRLQAEYRELQRESAD